MTELEIFTRPDAALLAEAFPRALRPDALSAGEAVRRQLHEEQRTERLVLRVEQEAVSIPARLHFASDEPENGLSGEALLMANCLRTRSNDGFERQRAVRHLLADPRPWSVAFIVIPLGEWVVEILEDVEAAMSPPLRDTLAGFVAENPAYWQLTKQRIASYWNAYHRFSTDRSNYVGFKLVRDIEASCRETAGVSAGPSASMSSP